MSILDFIFGDEVIEESEGVTHMEILDFCEEEIRRLKERINKLEEKQGNNKPANLWVSNFNYLKSYCPKCANLNTSQVPKKAKKSMKFVCEKCETEYRIMFDEENIAEVYGEADNE